MSGRTIVLTLALGVPEDLAQVADAVAAELGMPTSKLLDRIFYGIAMGSGDSLATAILGALQRLQAEARDN